MKARQSTDKRPANVAELPIDTEEKAVELGIWLSGIDSFMLHGRQAFCDPLDVGDDASSEREFRILQAGIYRCSILVSYLRSEELEKTGVSEAEKDQLVSAIRELIILGDAILTGNRLRQLEYSAWVRMVTKELIELPAVPKLVRNAERNGEKYLPEDVRSLLGGTVGDEDFRSELSLILPRFGIVLRWLSVVGRMLASDEPLKPSLLIFSRVNEQIFELTHFINNRISKYAGVESELFASLDAASYTATIELRKVYSQELLGISGIRPAPSVYSRIETSYALLYEGFQHIIAGFARDIDPNLDAFTIFPNLAEKRDRSVKLKDDLLKITNAVKAVEKAPDEAKAASLKRDLVEFRDSSARYLFYKDMETTSRFIEEVTLTRSASDLTPILHRFGAYLDTLFGQVQLRAMPKGDAAAGPHVPDQNAFE